MNEGYPPTWWHCEIHLEPETGTMHSDGDHRVREWLEKRLTSKNTESCMVTGYKSKVPKKRHLFYSTQDQIYNKGYNQAIDDMNK